MNFEEKFENDTQKDIPIEPSVRQKESSEQNPKKIYRSRDWEDGEILKLSGATRAERSLIRRHHPESRELRKVSYMAGTMMLIFTFFATFLVLSPKIFYDSYFRYIAYPFFWAENQFIMIFGEKISRILSHIMYSTVYFTVFSTIIAKIFGYKPSKLVALGRPKPKVAPSLIMFGVGICAFANVAASGVTEFLNKFGFRLPESGAENSPSGILGFLLVFISTAIVPGLVEEFAFRGIIYGALKKYGEGFAILASSVLFGVLHGNIVQIPFAFMVGLGLGFIRAKSGSIWLCVIVHMLNNAISVLMDYIPKGMEAEYVNVFYGIYLCAAMFLAILGICLFAKKDENRKSLSFKRETLLSDDISAKIFYFNPTVLAFLIYVIVFLYEGGIPLL